MTTFRRPFAACLGFALLALTSLSTEVRAQGTIKVGYYDMVLGEGNPEQVAPIVAAGFEPVKLLNVAAPDLAAAGIQVLFVQNPSNTMYGAEYLAGRPAIQNAVSAGMVLVIHDRAVGPATTPLILPAAGTPPLLATRTPFTVPVPPSSTNIQVSDPNTLVANGPGGVLTDTNLDNGNPSNLGFVNLGTPATRKGLLHTGTSGMSPRGQSVTFSYPFGLGFVIYSTIPLDGYLKGTGFNPPQDNLTTIYAPNLLAYAACSLRPSQPTVSVSAATGYYGGTTTLEAKLRCGATSLAGLAVDFSMNGTSVGSAKTDASGTATLTNVSLGATPDSAIDAGTYAGGVSASFAGAGLFTASSGAAALSVEKAPATLDVLGGTFVYDGAPHAATGSVTGVFQEMLDPPTFTYTDANGVTSESAPVDAGTYDVTATSTETANYLSTTNGSLKITIEKATPTVVVPDMTLTYSGAPQGATGTVTGVGGEDLGAPGFTYTPGPGEPTIAGSYAVLGSYAGSANYAAASGTATLTIEKATPIVVVPDSTLTYNGAPQGAAGTVTGIGGEDLGALSFTYKPGHGEPTNAGSYAVLGSYAESANYAAASDTATLTIAKATPTVVVPDSTFTYDGEPRRATGAVTGIGGEDLGAPSITYTPGPGRPTNAGSYAVLGSYDESANYAAASDTATLTIAKATPTVVVSAATFTYDGTPHGATGTVKGVRGEDLAAPSFTYTPGPGKPTNAGTYVVAAASMETANYLSTTVSSSITITPAPLTVMADDKERLFGKPNPVLTIRYKGFVNGETAASLDVKPTVTTAAVLESPPGTYPIVVGGALDSNYTIQHVNGALTISPEGRMHGDGFIDGGGARNHVNFDVSEGVAFGERGSLTLHIQHKVDDSKSKDNKGKDHKPRDDDRFVAHRVTSVTFSDNGDFGPGRGRGPLVDTVRFAGVGVWNGVSATFEAVASDMGEPGRGRDTLSVTIRVKGKKVAGVHGPLDRGNVQSNRLPGGNR